MKAFGGTGALAGSSSALALRAASGTKQATTRPAEIAVVAFRNSRRPVTASACIEEAGSVMALGSRHMAALLLELHGAMHGRADSLIRAAAAQVARHRGVDIRIARRGRLLEQRRRAH